VSQGQQFYLRFQDPPKFFLTQQLHWGVLSTGSSATGSDCQSQEEFWHDAMMDGVYTYGTLLD
jgi:hypothetical protein